MKRLFNFLFTNLYVYVWKMIATYEKAAFKSKLSALTLQVWMEKWLFGTWRARLTYLNTREPSFINFLTLPCKESCSWNLALGTGTVTCFVYYSSCE